MLRQMDNSRFQGISALAVCCLLLGARTASADMVISAGTAIALPGGQGALEIDLTNTGPAAVTITGFTFTVQADNDDVSFSQVTQAGTTAPYIFAGNSLDTALWPAFGLSGPN